jgi:RecB family endonuclease NucS
MPDGVPVSAPVLRPADYDEDWLRRLLFEHPELILLDGSGSIDGGVVPLCRELPIASLGGNVFVDLLGVTRSGRLVIVECKLWRNPQARREVVAQIVEYAALLRRWSFSDLTERIKRKTGSRSQPDLRSCEGGMA